MVAKKKKKKKKKSIPCKQNRKHFAIFVTPFKCAKYILKWNPKYATTSNGPSRNHAPVQDHDFVLRGRSNEQVER